MPKKMKNIKYLLIAIVGFLSSSCTEDFTPTFDKNPTERFLEQKNRFNEILKNSEHGWVLQSFPSSDQQHGGHNFYFNFEDNNILKTSYEFLDVTTNILTSTYAIKQSSGVYLSLDTYNNYAHFFATPTADRYQAFGGEFEYNLLDSSTNDTINIMGRKTRNKMRFIKLKESWADYNNKVTANRNLLPIAKIIGELGSNNISVNINERRIHFSFQENGENKLIAEAFIYTDKGISLYEPVEIFGKKYQNFNFNEEKTQMLPDNGDLVLKIFVPAIDLSSTGWELDISIPEQRADIIQQTFQSVFEENMKKEDETLLSKIFFGKRGKEVGIQFITGKGTKFYLAAFSLNFSGSSLGKEYLEINDAGESTNWRFYRHLNPLKDIFTKNTPYKLELNDAKNPTQVKLISVDNPSFWFVLNRRNS